MRISSGRRALITEILALCATLCTFCVSVEAQTKMPRIAFLALGTRPQTDAFRQGLRDVGYVEGKNIVFEYRYIEGKLDRIPSLVAELVLWNADNSSAAISFEEYELRRAL